jgi:hypothetical protein
LFHFSIKFKPYQYISSVQILLSANKPKKDFLTLANNISQLAWMADADGSIFWYNQRWFDYSAQH